jgi:hypothetical protein
MNFVLLNTYSNYVEAHIAKGVLADAGINSWLKDENTVTIDSVLTNAVGGIKLMVSEKQVIKAREILENLRAEQKASVTCPRCGSHNVELISTPRRALNWLSAMVTFFLGSYAIATDKVNHCFICGHEFPGQTGTAE